ncbi:MAG: dTMP kinase [Burkholderiaceae bacterium]|jgi:dTMP kinase|nr:dTMP kinase [Burkholderiaceae bacterium]
MLHANTPAQSAAAPPSTQGLFITFEGIDGAGKSTHIAAVADWFAGQGRAVVSTREPGGTPLAEQIRALALRQDMDALTEALLMFAARREHLAQVIAPALAAGKVVLCDRFTDATFAYQGGGRGFAWQTLRALERMVQAADSLPAAAGRGARVLQPDLTLWFDLPPAVAARRLSGARAPDKFEAQPQTFFEAVRAGYVRRQRENPRRFARIDANQTLQAVAQAVEQVVAQAHPPRAA